MPHVCEYMDRRAYLGLTSAVAVTLAGCGSEGSQDDERGAEPSSPYGEDAPLSDEEVTVDDTRASEAGSPTDLDADENTAIPGDYETTEVRVRSPTGERLGMVTAAIADTAELRYRGLSDTASLSEDRGMLFVYESVGHRTFVMREMDFGIDIVYADADGTITRIHHASAPDPDENGSNQEYPGRGQYVLEVAYNWTSDRGVSEGDLLEFALPGGSN